MKTRETRFSAGRTMVGFLLLLIWSALQSPGQEVDDGKRADEPAPATPEQLAQQHADSPDRLRAALDELLNNAQVEIDLATSEHKSLVDAAAPESVIRLAAQKLALAQRRKQTLQERIDLVLAGIDLAQMRQQIEKENEAALAAKAALEGELQALQNKPLEQGDLQAVASQADAVAQALAQAQQSLNDAQALLSASQQSKSAVVQDIAARKAEIEDVDAEIQETLKSQDGASAATLAEIRKVLEQRVAALSERDQVLDMKLRHLDQLLESRKLGVNTATALSEIAAKKRDTIQALVERRASEAEQKRIEEEKKRLVEQKKKLEQEMQDAGSVNERTIKAEELTTNSIQERVAAVNEAANQVDKEKQEFVYDVVQPRRDELQVRREVVNRKAISAEEYLSLKKAAEDMVRDCDTRLANIGQRISTAVENAREAESAERQSREKLQGQIRDRSNDANQARQMLGTFPTETQWNTAAEEWDKLCGQLAGIAETRAAAYRDLSKAYERMTGLLHEYKSEVLQCKNMFIEWIDFLKANYAGLTTTVMGISIPYPPWVVVPALVVIIVFFALCLWLVCKRLAGRASSAAGREALRNLRSLLVMLTLLLSFYTAANTLRLPEKMTATLNKVLLLLAVLLAFYLLAKILLSLLQHLAAKYEHAATMLGGLRTVLRIVLAAIAFLVVLDTLGVSIGPALATLGVGGLAVALALQDTLSNLFAGLHVIVSKQIQLGDFIRLESGQEGYVTDITWRNTTVRMLANNLVIVPNSKLASSLVVNYCRPTKDLAVLVQLGVSYDSDLAKVEKVTIEVAKSVMQEVKGGIPDFEPFIRYHTFGDFSIAFSVILRGREFVDQYLIKHEFIKRLQNRYAQEGIEIPFPIRTVHMKDRQ